MLAACGPAYDPVRLRLSTIEPGATGVGAATRVTLRDEGSGVVFTLRSQPSAGDVRAIGPLRHLHVEAIPPGGNRGQIVDVLSSPGAQPDSREQVETLLRMTADRGRIASRAARFQHGHPAMLLRLDEVRGAPGHGARVLVVSDGRVAAMLTDVVPYAELDDASLEVFDALRLPGD